MDEKNNSKSKFAMLNKTTFRIQFSSNGTTVPNKS